MKLKDGCNVVIIKDSKISKNDKNNKYKDNKDRMYWFDTDGHFEEDKEIVKILQKAKELGYTHYQYAGAMSISYIH